MMMWPLLDHNRNKAGHVAVKRLHVCARNGGTEAERSLNRALVAILAAVTLDAVGIELIFLILPALLRDVGHVSEAATRLSIMPAVARLGEC